jgi:hypothetical protein
MEVSTMSLGIRGFEESWLFQEYDQKGKAEGLAEGKAEGLIVKAREDLLRVGRKKFGDPSDSVLAQIGSLSDLDHLASLLEQVIDVSSWDELLSPSTPA